MLDIIILACIGIVLIFAVIYCILSVHEASKDHADKNLQHNEPRSMQRSWSSIERPVKKMLALLLLTYIPLGGLTLVLNEYVYVAWVVRHVNIIYSCFVGAFLYQAFIQPVTERMRDGSCEECHRNRH